MAESSVTDTGSASDTSSGTAVWRGLAIGTLAGLLGGLFGVGGGIIVVPGLIALTSMDRRLAHGTSLAATFPIAVASLATYAVHGNVDWTIALFLAVGAVAGAVVGTSLLQIIPKTPLTIIFVVTILATAVRLLLSDETLGRSALSPGGAIALVVIGFVTGVLAGMLGIGGGVVLVPAMVVLFSMVPVVAKGTSVAVIVPSALVGTLRNRTKRNADLRLAATIGLTGVVGAIVGGLLADSISDAVSNLMFAGLLVVVAALQVRSLFSAHPEHPVEGAAGA